MARPTRLRVLGTREVPADVAGEPDGRSVIEAFPQPPVAPAQGSPAAEDIMELLKKSHERMSGEVRQATAIAATAIEQANTATAGISALSDRATAIEKQTTHVGETVMAALSDHTNAKTAARQAVAAASLGVIQRLGERFAALATFAIDRAPAFLSLGAAVWLWSNVLPDPKILQLVALGLFGAVVVAPAIWLSSRKT